jgi:midasin
MKKVISFIASHYRNDKIWLRRTLPSKRDYKILLAIDDTLSMRDNGFFTLEALTTITDALHRLEVGQVAVAAIRDRMTLLQSFETSSNIPFLVSQFAFDFSAPKSADTAIANFVRDSNSLLDTQTGSLPFVIVLSDGRFNKATVRRYLSEARDKRYLYIFVVLDQVKDSILSMKSVEKKESGIKLVPYLKDFPFEYYCIVRDVK